MEVRARIMVFLLCLGMSWLGSRLFGEDVVPAPEATGLPGEPAAQAADEPRVVEPAAPDAPAVSNTVQAPGGLSRVDIASPFQPEQNTQLVARSHLRINDSATEDRFLKLVRSRNSTLEELTVVNRLLAEKQAELEKLLNKLKDEFGLRADCEYRLNRNANTIFEFLDDPSSSVESDLQQAEAQASATNNPPAGRLRGRPFKRLDSSEQAADFLRLNSSKRLTDNAIRVLKLLAREKDLELTMIEDSLAKSFSVTKDRDYHYDRETRTLYELVPVPAARKAEDSEADDEMKPAGTNANVQQSPPGEVSETAQ